MKAADIRAKSADELKEQLVNLRKEAFNLRFRAASGQLENTAQCKHIRREIAQIKTIMAQRELAAS